MSDHTSGFGNHQQEGEYVRRPDGVVEPSVLKQRVSLVWDGQLVEGTGVLVRDYPCCGCPSTAPDGGACVPGDGARCCRDHAHHCAGCGRICCFRHSVVQKSTGLRYCFLCVEAQPRNPEWVIFATVALIALLLLIFLKRQG